MSEQLSAIDVPGPAVAQVVIDLPLPHLDRPFDYLIPPDLADDVVPGCRVRVRFAGQRVDAFVVAVKESSQHEGRLSSLEKVVSSEPVLTPETLRLVRAVADRQAGTLADVLRLAIPPRHARAEAHPHLDAEFTSDIVEPVVWQRYTHGPEFLTELTNGGAPRVMVDAIPGLELARLVAEAVSATWQSGRGAIVCLPDAHLVSGWSEIFAEILGADQHVVLTSAQKPAARYRSFISVARGESRLVLGTRGAAWAPVSDLGLVVIVDDGNDLHAEQRAPYPHAREVLLTRSLLDDTGVLILSHSRSVEAHSLVRQGWCQVIGPDAATRRRAWPRVEVTDGSEQGAAPVRLPRAVFRAIRGAEGPVLIQVPRQGYRSALACQNCRTRAQCTACEGPLVQRSAQTPPVCRWCALRHDAWSCRECGGQQLRAPVVGQLRTAEEFAQAFPDREIHTSGGDAILTEVPTGSSLVLATPGAEPSVEGGYALVVLLDTWLMLARDDIRVVAESHRRWFEALALAEHGASAVAVGDSMHLQALVRADPVGVAEHELNDRAQTHLPPIGRLAMVDGPAEVINELANRRWTATTEVLGPVPLPEGKERLILRCPRSEGLELAAALKAVAAERSAAKLQPVRIQVDPISF